jgi:hypothetical protein
LFLSEEILSTDLLTTGKHLRVGIPFVAQSQKRHPKIKIDNDSNNDLPVVKQF